MAIKNIFISYKKWLCPPPLIQRPLLVGDVPCEGEHPGYRLLACTDKQIKGFLIYFAKKSYSIVSRCCILAPVPGSLHPALEEAGGGGDVDVGPLGVDAVLHDVPVLGPVLCSVYTR